MFGDPGADPLPEPGRGWLLGAGALLVIALGRQRGSERAGSGG